MTQTYSGTCFCGAVKLAVEGPPVAQGYCHCTDCRAWSATPMTAYSLWPSDKVRIVEGEEHVRRFDKMGKGLRFSCTLCGGALMAEMIGDDLCDVYPSLLEGLPFEPAMHLRYGQRMIDMIDDLPKFRDLPAEIGGSGELVEG